jgi:hypothetical protein
MKTLVSRAWVSLLVGVLVATLALASPAAQVPLHALPAGVVRAASTPVVFLGETPANGSLLGLLNPVTVVGVAYFDPLPNATVLGIDFHLDGMNLTSAGFFNSTAFALPVGFGLRDGPHFANFLLVDSYGNVAYHNWTFTVDTIPPILIVTSPAYPMVPVPAIPVQGTAFPALAVAAPVNVTVTALPSHVSLWSQANATTGAFTILMPLTEGANVLFVNATDAAGNLASQIATVIRDTTKPSLVILTPFNLSVSPTNLVHVAGLSDFGAYLTVNGFGAVVAPNGTWSVVLALPEGPNVIVVAAADSVGNLNYAVVVVLVDSDAPRITLASPIPSLTNRTSIDVSGYVNDTMLVAVVARCGQLLRTLTPDPVTGYVRTVFSGLPDGTYPVQITAVDAAQRSTTLASMVVVDTTPPLILIASRPDGLETNHSTVRLVGSVDDPSVTVLVNDQVLLPDAAGRWETTVALIGGTNVIRISAVDTAGNRAEPLLLHVAYYSPYPDLANRTAANEKNLDALGAFARLSLVGIAVLAVAVEFVLYMRTERKLREARRALSAVVRLMKKQPKAPGP